MANETPLTIVGNLTADPELRFTQSGTAIATFTVASTPRKYNSQTGQWDDGNPLFMRCTAWNKMAENVSESLTKGTRVIVTGNLRTDTWKDKNTGENRSAINLDTTDVAPSLRYATTRVTRNPQNNQGGGGYQQKQQRQQNQQNDPWGGRQSGNAWGPNADDQPPF